jgi:hypothetical protein
MLAQEEALCSFSIQYYLYMLYPQSGFPERKFVGLNSRMSSLVPSYVLKLLKKSASQGADAPTVLK